MEASKARKPVFVMGPGIADHAAEHKKVFIGHVDMGRHIGLGRADSVDLVLPLLIGS